MLFKNVLNLIYFHILLSFDTLSVIRRIVGGSEWSVSYLRQIAWLTGTNVFIWRISSTPVQESFIYSPRHRGRGSTSGLWNSVPFWMVRKGDGRWTEVASSVFTIKICTRDPIPTLLVKEFVDDLFLFPASAPQCLISVGRPAVESEARHLNRYLEGRYNEFSTGPD